MHPILVSPLMGLSSNISRSNLGYHPERRLLASSGNTRTSDWAPEKSRITQEYFVGFSWRIFPGLVMPSLWAGPAQLRNTHSPIAQDKLNLSKGTMGTLQGERLKQTTGCDFPCFHFSTIEGGAEERLVNIRILFTAVAITKN